MKRLLTILALGIFSIGSAYAGASVNLLGGLNFQNNSVDPANSGQTNSAKGAVSFGATGEFGINPMMAFEIGVLSVTAKTKASTAAGDATFSVKAMEIPVMLRFTALPVLDLGIGGYYAILPDKYSIEGSTIAGLANGEYTTNTTEKADYGLRLGARGKFSIAPMLKFLVDASYDFGLKDTDKTSSTEKTRQYMLMAGVSIGF